MCKLYRRNFVKHELMDTHLLGIGVDLLSCEPLRFAWQHTEQLTHFVYLLLLVMRPQESRAPVPTSGIQVVLAIAT